jgi:hypothetical protein
MPRCRFCRTEGHSINRCDNVLAERIIENLTIELRNIHNRRLLLHTLKQKTAEVLALYAKEFGLKTSLPKSVHIQQLFMIVHTANIRSHEDISQRLQLFQQDLPARIGIDFERNAREIAMQIVFVMHHYPDITYTIIEDCFQRRIRNSTNPFRKTELIQAFQMGVSEFFANMDEHYALANTRVWKIQHTVHSCEKEEEKECPICMNEFPEKNMIFTNCRHHYCHSCMVGLIEKTTTNSKPPGCALCRAVIDQVHVTSELSSSYDKYQDTVVNVV